MSSSQSNICDLTINQSDLKKLEELDPFQSDGFETYARIELPVKIIFSSETGQETVDTQTVQFQLLCRWLKNPMKQKDHPALDCMRVYISSEDDIFLSFVSNCSKAVFETMCNKVAINLKFRDFPESLLRILKNCAENKGNTYAELRLSYEGTVRLYICENAEYKRIELIQLFFTATNIEKGHQSIIYRYNYNKSKLAMIENSIEGIYKILAIKNPPLLHYIQKTVGIDQ